MIFPARLEADRFSHTGLLRSRSMDRSPRCALRSRVSNFSIGFVIARRSRQLGVPCMVVAPSMTPRRSGERIKTDRRDAVKLARLLRAGELKAIYIPESTDEAIRDLCRARSDAVDDLRRSRHRLKALLLRHGYRYHGKSAWSQAHMRYLRELVLPDPAMKVILEDYLMAISAPRTNPTGETAMIDRLASWRLKPAVDALMAFKGFQLLAAIIVCGSVPTDNPRKHGREHTVLFRTACSRPKRFRTHKV
jgi:transposase